MESVEKALASSEELRTRLATLQKLLEPLGEDTEQYEPSADLVERTMAQLPEPISVPHSQDVEGKPEVSGRNRLSLSSSLELVRFDSSLLDVLIATAASLTALALLFPGILGSRELARKEACGENLRTLGNALAAFADRNAQRQLPQIELTGPLAFAGVYAPRLNECGLLENPGSRVCPSYRVDMVTDSYIPSIESILSMDFRMLKWVQRTVGGTYAFNMGSWNEPCYRPFPMTGRPNIAVMADAPVEGSDGQARSAHPRNCFNILFEDGRVGTVRLDDDSMVPDHPFLNRQGNREAGVDFEDASLGPSYLPPVRLIGR